MAGSVSWARKRDCWGADAGGRSVKGGVGNEERRVVPRSGMKGAKGVETGTGRPAAHAVVDVRLTSYSLESLLSMSS